jgi:hypothetical protein
MYPSFDIPIATMVGSDPAAVPTGVLSWGPFIGFDLAALAPLLLGAFLWAVLLAAMQAKREDGYAAPRAPLSARPRGGEFPAAA